MPMLSYGHRAPFLQALRRLRRDWAFTAAFALTLAFGLAANAAVFSAMDAYFLRPLPYPHGERLFNIHFGITKFPLGGGEWMSAAGYERLRSVRALASSGLTAGLGNLTVEVPGERPANHPVAAVTASALQTLSVRPLMGRWIAPASDLVGGPAEVDVSYGLWQSALHGGPHVLGRTLRVSGRLYTIVGVMPPNFAFPSRHTQLWTPIVLTPAMRRLRHLGEFNYVMIARLRPGSSRTELTTETDGVLHRLERAMPPKERKAFRRVGLYIAFTPLRKWLGGATRGRLLLMQLGAGILLLLAVASLLNLALARALRRRDEAAVRVALGAGRRVLLAQALLEAVPLGVAAVLVAAPLTELGMAALTRFGVASASTTFNLHVGAGLWLMSLGVALVLSSAALALPQAFVRVHRPAGLLYGRDKGGGGRMRSVRLALSVGQIALAIALLAGSVLIGRSLRNMLQSNPGFDSRHLYTAMVQLQGARYRKWGAWLEAHRRLGAAVAALPGVDAQGVGEDLPFSASGATASFYPAKSRSRHARRSVGAITMAGTGLMSTLGVHLLAGRLLDARDVSSDSLNVVIDERFADALFGGPDDVGRTLRCGMGSLTCRIVGVIGTIHDHFDRYYAFASGSVFVPENPRMFARWGGGITMMLIRSREPRALLGREIRGIIRRTLPDQTLIAFVPMRELIRNAARGASALASLLIAFGLLAFTLATIGTYGVVAYVTGQRRREFALRQAVGAAPGTIELLVLRQGAVLWLLGTLLGVGCALLFARSLAADLYRVDALSPLTYALPALVVGGAVMLAAWIPARSTRRLDLNAQIGPD